MTSRMPRGLANFRDLGGLPTEDGGRTRPGVLYRSDAPHPADEPPQAPVWPPAAVVDLRSGDEPIDPHPLREAGVPVENVPLLGDARPRTLEELRASGGLSFAGLYREITERAGRETASVLELATRTGGPVLVHCAAGKDRTGVLIALLLRAAGVRREAVVEDYLRTGPAMAGVRRRLSADDAEVEAIMTEFPDALGTPVEAIDAVLDDVERDGSTRDWLRARGTPPDLLDRWRETLVGA